MHEYSFLLRFNKVTVFDIWNSDVCHSFLKIAHRIEFELVYTVLMDFQNKEIYDLFF
jgi:hypothetical protein